jgi:predicted metal-dependent HD superfamily phosphohydrolase
MRIALFAPDLRGHSGWSRYALDLGKAFAAQGHEVLAVVSEASGADWCEESSARYFEKLARIYRADDAIVADVAKGILASRNHFDRDPLLSETTHLFLDGDLHTFALEDHDAYLAIVSGIREEAFACGATEAVFRAGRISFLEKVLLRTADRFFHSPSFAPFDRLARRNIEAELATLRASVP